MFLSRILIAAHKATIILYNDSLIISRDFVKFIWEPLKTGLKRENG